MRTLSLLGFSLYTNRKSVRWYQQESFLFHLSDSVNNKNNSKHKKSCSVYEWLVFHTNKQSSQLYFTRQFERLALLISKFPLLIHRKARSRKPDDDKASDTKLYLKQDALQRSISDTIPDADIKQLVELPDIGIDYCEWLASHTLALFGNVNLIYGSVSEFCTPISCPEMNGPEGKWVLFSFFCSFQGPLTNLPWTSRTYLWYDEKGRKTKVHARQYIDYVMTYICRITSDETFFSHKIWQRISGVFSLWSGRQQDPSTFIPCDSSLVRGTFPRSAVTQVASTFEFDVCSSDRVQ